MASTPRPDTTDAIAARLRRIRIAFGIVQGYAVEMSQSEFARQCGIGIAAWNNAETGDNRMGLDNAMKVAALTGVGLDYIFRNDKRLIPHVIAVEIDKLEAAERGRSVKKAQPAS